MKTLAITIAFIQVVCLSFGQLLSVHYPLVTDLNEENGTFGPIEINGTTTGPPSAICMDQPYMSGNAVTPNIDGLDTSNFKVQVDFKLNDVNNGDVILVAGMSYRWFGILLINGSATVLYNNSNYLISDIEINPNIWYHAELSYSFGHVLLTIDGATAIDDYIENFDLALYDLNFGISNFANGGILNGCIKGLIIENLPPPSVSIATNSTVLCNGSTTATFTATPINMGTSIFYQWQINGSDIFGENETTFTPTDLADGDVVSVYAEGNYIGPNPLPRTSNSITITLSNELVSITGVTSLCAGTTALLTGSGTPHLTTPWTSSNPTIATISNTGLVSGLIAGTTTITYKTSGGCTDTSVIKVDPIPAITFNIADKICQGATAPILNTTSNEGIVGTWLPTTVTNMSTQNYTFTATATACALPVIKTVTVVNAPTATITADTAVCEGSAGVIHVTGTPNTTITYTVNGGGTQNQLITQTGAATILTTQFLNTATYSFNTITLSNDPFCSTPINSTLLFTMKPAPAPSYTTDIKAGCVPVEVTFTNNTSSFADCKWNFGNGVLSTNEPTIKRLFDKAGKYTIIMNVIYANGCSRTLVDSNSIAAEATPEAIFGMNKTWVSYIYSQITFTNVSRDATDYTWDFGDNKTSKEPSLDHVYIVKHGDSTFTVRLIATSQFGCVDTMTQTIRVQEDLIYYIPNVFSPNDDLVNPIFTPVFYSGFTTEDYSFTVYNRYGELIFETTDITQGWDGKYKDNAVDDGNYAYQIAFGSNIDSKRFHLTGQVSVLK